MDWNALAAPWIAQERPIELAHLPVRDILLDRAALKPGEKVLDIGCGSGGLSLDAADRVGPSGEVIAFDIASDFVRRVQERATDAHPIRAVEGNAQDHDFSAFACTSVISLFGMMFFDDPAAAFANIANAVVPGGRIDFVTWAGPEHNPWFSVPGRALAETLPAMPKPDPSAPGPMAFANTEMVTGLIADAGLTGAAATEVDLHLTPPGTAAEITAMMLAIGPFRGAIKAFGAPEDEDKLLEAVSAKITDGYGAFGTPEGVRVPARVVFYSAQRPA